MRAIGGLYNHTNIGIAGQPAPNQVDYTYTLTLPFPPLNVQYQSPPGTAVDDLGRSISSSGPVPVT